MLKNEQISAAIKSLCPEAQWALTGDSIDGLDWHTPSIPKPTEKQILAEIARLEKEFADNKYQRDRAKAYPSVVDQLDTLYHGGFDAWKAMIETIKNKYPKP
jgi:hypothetical protein